MFFVFLLRILFMKSVMQHQFSQVPSVTIPRSSFDRSHGYKTTFDTGYLVPIFVDEALPGDTFNLRTSGFVRLSTPLFPVMDNMFLETFYFAVPIRLIWDNFVKMMGEQVDPGDSTDYRMPIYDTTSTPFDPNSLHDYMGIPVGVTGIDVNSLWGRAYNLIWNQWFRDQNLQQSVVVDRDDGPDTISDYVLLRRGKRHDYFTSCLPWPQKGTVVDVPLGISAPITGIAAATNTYTPGAPGYETDGTGTITYANLLTGSNLYFEEDPLNAGFPNLRVDLTNATGATINSFRQAMQIQAMFERDARSGTRYIESVKAHFGVTSPDLRVTRSEYLGGGSAPINFHPVAGTGDFGITAGDPNAINTGGLRAFATSAFNGHGFTKSFTEHCVLIGLANVRADITYQQGLNRMFSRRDRLDMYLPVLSQIGEQAVLSKEIYCDGSGADEDVFGYQERFAEYRYKPSQITGEFRSSFAQSLDSWHLAQDFASRPLLNDTFIQDNPPVARIVQDTTDPQLIGDFYHKLITARPMPLYGVPGSLMRF